VGLSLRISRDRIVLYGSAIFIAGLYQLVVQVVRDLNRSDWSSIWSGGATVGTPALMDPKLHCAFQQAHHVWCGIWAYPPAVALFVWPVAKLSMPLSYAIDLIVMSAFAVIAGIVLADAFDVPRWLGVFMTLVWPPTKYAIVSGQNETLALLLIALAIAAAKHNRQLLVGLAVGALLFKPTVGLPFVVLIVLRREWRALAVVMVIAAVWYFTGVMAAANSWHWPAQYAADLRGYFAGDFFSNASKSASLPDVLMQAGASPVMATVAGIGLFICAVPRLLRVPLSAALAIVSIVGVAISLHAWNYTVTVGLPAVFYVMRAVKEPMRTWIVAASYALSILSIILIPGFTAWNLEAVVVLGLTAILITGAFTEPRPAAARV
jgi:hypothetical protein